MKNKRNLWLFIAIIAIAGIIAVSCGDGEESWCDHEIDIANKKSISFGVFEGPCIKCGDPTAHEFTYEIGDTGPAGGIIVYVADGEDGKSDGFTVTGAGSFTAYYLEAAPVNQGTSLRWATATDTLYATIDSAANAQAIGTGRNNTALILAGDPTAPAALACKNYNGGGKNDWFLPSFRELNEMYKARTHLGISTGGFWSSSQKNNFDTEGRDFGNGIYDGFKGNSNNVRAVRAF